MNDAALALSLKSSWDSISLALISQRLQNWFRIREISAQGLVPISLSLVKNIPGSPAPDASILFHKSKKKSLVILRLNKTTELFALPLCGLFSHHFPDFPVSFSKQVKLFICS